MANSDTLPLDGLEQQFGEIEKAVSEDVRTATRSVPEHRLLIEQAEWHARGVLYHAPLHV